MEQPITVGLVGAGKMGAIRADCLDRSEAFELVSVCDPDPAHLEAHAARDRFQDYRELLDGPVDAVFVATPNHVTSQIVVEALQRGKHVFCEKPPGRDVADVARILEAEQRSGGAKLKFGFNHRYHGSIREAKALVDGGRLGPLLWMRGVYGKSGEPNFDASWRGQRALSGGGILLDQGIHMLDLFRFFAGEFVEVKSIVTTLLWDLDIEDNAFAILRGGEGAIASLHSSSTLWRHQFTLDIGVSEGYLSIGGIVTSSRSYGDESLRIGRREPGGRDLAYGKPKEEIVYFDRDDSWDLEVADFANCILRDEPVEAGSSIDALAVMELVEEIYRDGSAGTRDDRQPVTRIGS